MQMNYGKKIYLSGPMTGKPNLNFDEFNKTAQLLREKGWIVVNPVDIEPNKDAKWIDCMVKDIQEVANCHIIAMLPGWEDSYGARIERLVAEKLGLKIWSANQLIMWGPECAEIF